MKIHKIVAGLIVLTVLALLPSWGLAQITSTANAVVPTEYSSGSQDNIHVFCGNKGELNASLIATSPTAEASTFEWLKYNVSTGNFDPFLSDQAGGTTSTTPPLQDGAYRVNITSTSGVKTYTALVFNNYIVTTAVITDSDCNSFKLNGTQDSPNFSYVDLNNGQNKVLNKGIKVNWTANNTTVSSVLTSQVFDPPTDDTDYTLTVSDRFNCVGSSVVKYISIVTKASFSHKEETQTHIPVGFKEAPLKVTFTNESKNFDAGKIEWFIFRDLDEIKRESQANPGTVIDSFLTTFYNDGPYVEYTFEKPGTYNVKMVSQKTSEFMTCYKTIYIDIPIVINESFIEAPNFFTPGGNDQVNNEFVIRFFSMKTVKISIFNRWGKSVHVWENNNVQGFGATWASDPKAIWDGKIGGKLATSGVYYYVVEGIGRDDKKRNTAGFVHLFSGK